MLLMCDVKDKCIVMTKKLYLLLYQFAANSCLISNIPNVILTS